MNRSQHFGILLLALILLGLFGASTAKRLVADYVFSPQHFSISDIKYVEVSGNNVCRPGVYSFYHEPVMGDVLAKAGMLTDFQFSSVELKRPVKNGSRILLNNEGGVYRYQIVRMDNSERLLLGIPLSLNTSSQTDLELLPGLGPSLAARVIEYRSKAGRFQSVDQIRNVEGIGEKKYHQLLPYVCVSE